MQNINKKITFELFKNQDLKYRDFTSKLTPTIDKSKFIGVRVPALRKLAKQFYKEDDIFDFLNNLPHKYVEENTLHGLILCEINDYKKVVQMLDVFLPYVDNWATCDIISPKVFKKNKDCLIKDINCWINSKHTYTVRFGIEMAMTHFLDEDFDVDFLDKISKIRSNEYYVNMMKAWYFATALTKQWDDTLPFIKEEKLDVWSHNKSIQKARESRRITSKQKELLMSMKIKNI